MNQQRYKVICDQCKGSREIDLHETPMGKRIDWFDGEVDPFIAKIVSGRERLDGQFGWQCICGNNDMITEQEATTISNLASPKPQEINDIVKNLIPSKPKFTMVTL